MDETQAAKRIQKLRAQIDHHNRLYYVEAAPQISDRQYDELDQELRDLERRFPRLRTPDSPTQRVGGEPLSEFVTRPHAIPMLSLDNTYSVEDLRRFHRRVTEGVRQDSVRFVIEPKIDGVSISLRYERGLLVQALTRGNGREGDDVTANVRTIKSIPLRLRAETVPEVWEARGEIFMNRDDFAHLNARRRAAGEAEFANARNATAGTLKQLDPRVVAKRPLDAILYAQGEVRGIDLSTQQELLRWLQRFGFKTASFVATAEDFEGLWDAIQRLERERPHFPYDIDGAVIKVDEFTLRERLGTTAKAPSWAIAYKYAAERAPTKLRTITVQVGRTGILTPVAELEPMPLAGSTISRATLHNEDEVRRKDIRIGDTVLIEKAGEVIPAVIEVVLSERPAGTTPFDLYAYVQGQCPSCGGPIYRDPEFVAWRCGNLQCPAQSIRRIQHFAARNAMDIEALGGIVAERLVESGLIAEPLDLFDLDKDRLARLNLGTESEPRVFGEKNAAKLLRAVDKARTLSLARWLHASGIPNTGVTTAAQIAAVHRDLEDVAESELLRHIIELPRLHEEAREVNPNATRNRPGTEAEREQRRARMAELTARIRDIGEELSALGLARPKAGAGETTDRPEYVTTQFGPVAAASVLDYFASDIGRAHLERLARLGIHPQGGAVAGGARAGQPDGASLAGKTFVLTGTLTTMGRDEAAEAIRGRGGNAAGSVSKNTDYVIVGEAPGASKTRKAEQLGIPMIGEEQFLALLGTGDEKEPDPKSPPDDLFSWAGGRD